jgi:hypothetical protein
LILVIAGLYLIFRARGISVRRAPAWDCGFEKMTSRMQYTSTSMSMPTRKIFGFAFSIKETVSVISRGAGGIFPEKYLYRLKVRDHIWNLGYKPVSEAAFWVARKSACSSTAGYRYTSFILS